MKRELEKCSLVVFMILYAPFVILWFFFGNDAAGKRGIWFTGRKMLLKPGDCPMKKLTHENREKIACKPGDRKQLKSGFFQRSKGILQVWYFIETPQTDHCIDPKQSAFHMFLTRRGLLQNMLCFQKACAVTKKPWRKTTESIKG